MPGFFDFMKRMAEGKPVFTNESDAPTPPIAAPAGPAIRKGDDRSFPVVRVEHVTTRFDGDRMRVYLRIINEWPEEILLDKIRAFGMVHEIDDFLRGGQQHEFLVYDGPRLDRQYHEAQLDYKTKREGDYFQAIHDVKFTYHAEDKTYSVDEMHLRRPIRDIYG